jgi:folate-dependent phosphoribosylglycinamide formyltransferase PurN
VKDLNSRKAISYVEESRADMTIYGGGGIVGRSFLDGSGHRVLNAHAGPLPEVRGMNAVEWSLVLGLPLTVSVHFVEVGVDTGPVVLEAPIPVEEGDDIPRLREKSVVIGVQTMVRAVEELHYTKPRWADEPKAFRQCFSMAPAMLEVASSRLTGARSQPS